MQIMKPKQLLAIGRRNPTVKKNIDLWLNGETSYFDCLEQLIHQLIFELELGWSKLGKDPKEHPLPKVPVLKAGYSDLEREQKFLNQIEIGLQIQEAQNILMLNNKSIKTIDIPL